MSNPAETISTNPCPHCLTATGKVNLLRNRQGAFYTYCEGETHKFSDSDELAALVNQAKLKFPEHFPQKKSPASNPPKLAHFTVDPDNKKAIEELIGPINGAGELKSAIWELKNQVIELNQAAANAAAAKVATPASVTTAADQVVYRIPEVYFENISEMANYEEKNLTEYLQGIFDQYVEAFFTQGVRRSA